MVVLKNILVATDFSEPSGVALAYGRDLARTYDATLQVLSVVDDVMLRYSGELGFPPPADLQKDLKDAAARELDKVISDDDRRTLKVVPMVEVDSNIAAAIVECASACATDLIIVGTHGRGGMHHLLMGSVAERVVRTAPCPVLAVRAKERDFIVPDALATVARA